MKIGIIGCGYIGNSLAQYWAEKGHFITAVARSPKKLEEFSKKAQKKIIFDKKDQTEIYLFLEENELIVLTAFADKQEDYESDYLEIAQALKQAAIELGEKRDLIYAGACSVYGDHQGQWVDEESKLNANTEGTLLQIEIENTLLSLKELDWRITILRLADIYGKGMELTQIVKNMDEYTLPGSGGNYTNMVHQEDIINAVNYLLNHRLDGIYNLADDEHPTQKELLNKICKKNRFPKIKWDKSRALLRNVNFRVSNHKIKAAGYNFIHPERVLT